MCHGSAGPYVTSVGGTTNHDPEIAASFSGGGFSNYFQREEWQDEEVSIFLDDLGNHYLYHYKCVRCCDVM